MQFPVAGPSNTHPGPLRALAATARLANVPSVASNVMLGMLPVVGADFGAGVAFALMAAVCLYFSGGFLNDWSDHQWDAARRPERALPLGLFKPRFYLTTGLAMAACGTAAAALAGGFAPVVAVMLALNIGLYTWLHKKTAWSAVFMGLCRALLPVLGWAATGGASALMPVAILAGVALFFHVAGISLLARGESKKTASPLTGFAYSSFVCSALMMAFAAHRVMEVPVYIAACGLTPYALWTGYCLLARMETGKRVAGLLAGIPLVDWMLLLAIHLHGTGGGNWQMCLWVPPLAFVAGKALQRLAPAT